VGGDTPKYYLEIKWDGETERQKKEYVFDLGRYIGEGHNESVLPPKQMSEGD